MKKFITSLLAVCVILSMASVAVFADTTYKYEDYKSNWGTGENPMAGLWRFEYRKADGTFVPYTYYSSSSGYFRISDSEKTELGLSDTWPRARAEGIDIHPTYELDSARAFIVPEDGVIDYSVEVTRKYNMSEKGGDGSAFYVMLNDTLIYPVGDDAGADVGYVMLCEVSDAITVTFTDLAVKAGDAIHLCVGSGPNNERNQDAIYLNNETITLKAASAETDAPATDAPATEAPATEVPATAAPSTTTDSTTASQTSDTAIIGAVVLSAAAAAVVAISKKRK